MFLAETELRSYRNYQFCRQQWHPGMNILLGANAQGKTNFIEAIFLLSLGKSHRTSKDKELIGWDAEFSVIKGRLNRKKGPVSLELHITERGKKAKINGVEQRRLSDYIGTLNVVLFAPEDLNLVKGPPGIRRRFLDMEIGQISPSYLYNISNYSKILAQRNQLLKEHAHKEIKGELLSIWDEQLAHYGVKILFKRWEFLDKLQHWAQEIHGKITNGKEELAIGYKQTIPAGRDCSPEEAYRLYLEQMRKNRDQEVNRGTTLIGPHRDDLVISINGKDVQSYGSQGQQRTAALSLKLAEIELICQEIGEYPVLLLDDVFSELDENRQTHLLESIKDKCQTFVTTTNIDGIHSDTLHEAKVYWISQGTIQEKN